MALFLFDTEITLSSGLPNNQRMELALGNKTIVHWTSTQSLTFIGLALTGGLTPADHMVAVFSNLNNNSFTQSFANESVTEATAAFRFRNAGLATVTGGTGAGCVWYRYRGAVARWIQINQT